ncbi:unnamed protein product [Oppiella nova]|uniref:FtsK domain-containing protein n=1 Tax=Oppiella nova TaxID=334625 RepID=A0A7R9Q8N0_9ACAR|nr:unnamed protein product [Oppiella nova]CAG2157276.1 unnamed protein product [Oppiella nova]
MTAVSNVYAQRFLTTIFLISFGIYLFLATVTYTPFDPGWMHISSDTQQVSNASGVAGAWIADLLFGFLGWAKAVQVWWPRSFVSRPFRYAAQFFILLATSSLLYLLWNVPADTLANASGGIIGYELGESLSQLMSIYGAVVFILLLLVVLFTLAFGIQWNRTWATLKATPAYLQDLFYKNVPEKRTLEKAHRLEQDSQRTVSSGEVWKALHQDQDHNRDIDALIKASEDQTEDKYADHLPRAHQHDVDPVQINKKSSLDWDDDQVFDELLSVVPNGQTATDIHSPFNSATTQAQAEAGYVDTAVQGGQSFASGVAVAATSGVAIQNLANELDELASLADEELTEPPTAYQQNQQSADVRTTSNYAQSTPFTRANIQTNLNASTLVSEEEKSLIAADKDAFRDAWQETAGKPQDELQSEFAELEDDFDLDAPLTDAFGRPMSRAMQVANKRRDLPTLPGYELLDKVDPNKKVNFTAEQLSRLSELLEIKLQEFNVKAKVIEAQPGPVVTRFELDLAPGVKASKVTNISRDLARSMSMASVRVVEVIPGKPYIGIEVPNSSREMVRLIELLETPVFKDPNGLLSMAMGKDISGNPVITDLGKAPHMLVAGTTGSGKSVAVNSMILSMLLKYTPDQLRLILIDPKQLELANYNDIPHLLTPVVTDMKDAVSALNWCVNEMERRYKLMSFLKIRKLADYNRKVEEAIANGEDLIDPTWKPSDSATQDRAPRLQPLPSIVIVADEFADMIMQVGKKAEEMITRLAQKSRAAGIHLLLATQRPSVDVITGLIKANIPTRVALRVNSKIDSRTILDGGGAEDLLGHGDMLFLGPGKIDPERVHGAFISDDEVNRICDAWRERGEPNYVDEILTPFDEEPTTRGFEDGDGDPNRDALYDQCVSFVLETRKVSVSSLQRKFSLGYNRAARIVDQMQEQGIVSEQGPNGKRDILV